MIRVLPGEIHANPAQYKLALKVAREDGLTVVLDPRVEVGNLYSRDRDDS